LIAWNVVDDNEDGAPASLFADSVLNGAAAWLALEIFMEW
jgi:hypothetical protein